MSLFSSGGEYFALDIGTTAIRVVQLVGNEGSWRLEKYGIAPVDIRVSNSDAVGDQKKLGEVIATAIGQSGIKAKDVILGIPSNKMFATVIDMPDLSAIELAATIKYQAEQYIPMNVDEVKIDWAVLGKSVNDPNKNEVLLASVANKFSEARLDMIEGLGLNVIAIEPDSIALTRALLPPGVNDARVIIEIGDFATDIVMVYNDAPRLVRSLPTGLQTLVKATAQNLNIEPAQATQFILKFGLQEDKLEGQVARALATSVEQFSTEISKSVKFFQTKYPTIPVNGAIISGYGVTIPGLAEYTASKTGLQVTYGNPWQQVRVSQEDQQKLQGFSAQFAVAIGLAQRGTAA